MRRPFLLFARSYSRFAKNNSRLIGSNQRGRSVGQAKQKKLSQKQMVEAAPRCIYCSRGPTTVEHMPPLMLFDGRKRPSGLVFPACSDCNNKTKGADVAAAFFSRINKSGPADFWKSQAGKNLQASFERDAPLAHLEFMQLPKSNVLLRNNAGILLDGIKMRANGPNLVRHLNVFSAKIAMALFHEHTGAALPDNGLVQAAWYMNHGLSEEQTNAMLKILPAQGELKQGQFSVWDQFAYRFNSDERTITAGLVGLHKNLHIFFIASSTPEAYGLPVSGVLDPSTSFVTSPGSLIDMLRPALSTT